MAKYRVLIADDHPVVIEGLRSKLSSDASIQVIGDVSDSRKIIDRVKELKPTVLILDLSMPQLDGTEVISAVKRLSAATKIIVFTVNDATQTVHECLLRGAEAYVVKHDELADILTAVKSVIEGYSFLSPCITQLLIEHYLAMSRTSPSLQTPMDILTLQELDIVRLTAQGLRSREIAKRLGLAVKTVDNYRYRIRQKLNLPSLSALVSYAIDQGLVQL